MKRFFPLTKEAVQVITENEELIAVLCEIIDESIDSFIDTIENNALQHNIFADINVEYRRLPKKYMRLMLRRPLSKKEGINRSFALSVLRIGGDDIVFRSFWYKVGFDLLVKCQAAKENPAVEYALRLILGHHGGEVERSIYHERNAHRKIIFTKYDKETFEIYNESIAHNITNNVAKIVGVTNNLIHCVKANQSQRIGEYMGSREGNYNKTVDEIRNFLQKIKSFSSSSNFKKYSTRSEVDFVLTEVIGDRFFDEIKIMLCNETTEDFEAKINELGLIRAVYPLVLNAIEAKAKMLIIKTTKNADYLYIDVSNDGDPIASEENIFSEFFTTKGQEGYGLSYAEESSDGITLIEPDPVTFRIRFKLT